MRRSFRPPPRITPRDIPGITSRAESGEAHHGERFLLFEVGAEQCAIAAVFLREVAFPDGIEPTAGSERLECVAFSHRGGAIPALDLRVLFDYPLGSRAGAARVLVGERDGERLGLVVDRVGDVVDVGPQAILPIPEGISQLSAGCFRGVMRCGERVTLVLETGGLAALGCVRQFGDVVVSPAAGLAETESLGGRDGGTDPGRRR